MPDLRLVRPRWPAGCRVLGVVLAYLLAVVAVLAVSLELGAAAASAAVPVPVITSPADGSTVTSAEPRLSGTGAPGDTVVVSDAGFVRCVATVAADGRWSCTPVTLLANGPQFITANQIDRAGASSAGTASVSITVRAPLPRTGTPTQRSSSPTVVVSTSPIAVTSPRPSLTTTTPAGRPHAESASSRLAPLAIAAVVVLGLVAGAAAFLRLRP